MAIGLLSDLRQAARTRILYTIQVLVSRTNLSFMAFVVADGDLKGGQYSFLFVSNQFDGTSSTSLLSVKTTTAYILAECYTFVCPK